MFMKLDVLSYLEWKDIIKTHIRNIWPKRRFRFALNEDLTTISHGFTDRMIQERLQHSDTLISQLFKMVLNVGYLMIIDMLKPSDTV